MEGGQIVLTKRRFWSAARMSAVSNEVEEIFEVLAAQRAAKCNARTNRRSIPGKLQ